MKRFLRKGYLLVSAVALYGCLGGGISLAQVHDPLEAYDNAMVSCINKISPGFVESFMSFTFKDPSKVTAKDVPEPVLGRTLPEQSRKLKGLVKCMDEKGFRPLDMDDFAMYDSLLDSYLDSARKNAPPVTEQKPGRNPQQGAPHVPDKAEPKGSEQESGKGNKLFITPSEKQRGGNRLFVPGN